MFIKYWFFLGLFTLLGHWQPAMAQGSFELGVLPAVNINRKFDQGWSLNMKVESRAMLRQPAVDQENIWDPDYVLTDFILLGSRKVGLAHSVAAGYVFRWRPGDNAHRSVQQFTFVQPLTGVRLAHRISTDQTFSEQEPPVFRLRYRLVAEWPLSGQELDPREPYLKLGNEYLQAWQATSADLEIRAIPTLGYAFNDNNKVELGLDYRINSFVNGATEQTLWTAVQWFLTW
ncbi:MAG: DUF2490 domain-containing protein [Bacteroidetes bacterium]|nr:DUF2490 domain-containing protein [Bacteroidota bacterium]